MRPEELAGARVYDLEQPRTATSPIHPAHVPPGYSYLLHRRHEPGAERRTGAAGVVVTSEHAGTHIDALSHQAEDLRLHGDVEISHRVQTSTGFRQRGVEEIAPIVARGVLVDLAPGGMLERNDAVTLEEVRRACAEQDVEPRRGDVFLARFGTGALWSEPARYLAAPGMAGEVSEWLAGVGVRAVGADNVAWDAVTPQPDPITGTTLPGHVLLLVRAGIHILENLHLEDLARDGVHEFGFVCLPLKLVGATGSPVRPIALV